jgi:hypothetical protein
MPTATNNGINVLAVLLLNILALSNKQKDGGYILGGYSYSGIGGDKTEDHWGKYGNGDYWIVKTDVNGNKQWDKRFGGTAPDYLFSIQQTMDGGYILGGYSGSGISGDKNRRWPRIF